MGDCKYISIGPAFPYRGGIANFNESLTGTLNSNNFNTEIVTFKYQYPGILFPGKTQYAEKEAVDGLSIDRLIHSINPFNWYRVAKKIVKKNPELIIVHYWMPFFAPGLGKICRIVKKKTKCKIIAITHNVIPHEKRLGDTLLSRYFVNSCDGFITLAKSVLEDLDTFTDNKHKVFLPHPIYDFFGKGIEPGRALSKLKLDPEKRYLLFFGIIRPYKGLDLLIEALSLLKDKMPDICLIVAGEFYEAKEGYLSMIEEYGLKNNVIIHDHFISNEDVKLYFSATDLVVQPYRTATQSGVTQIAYHFDKPMLVTEVGGLPEIVPHLKVGYVVKKEAQDIADSIIDFYKNERNEFFISNIKVEKKRFSWDSFCEKLIDFSRTI